MDPSSGRTPISILESGEVDTTLDAGFYKTPTSEEETDEPDETDTTKNVYLPLISR